ncbi:MAG: dephospho-CoA kinase [Desulfohalobiaceae bacterium]|nr:dephospho-CoA kinase [Desulfohalobiaceae bacterium]
MKATLQEQTGKLEQRLAQARGQASLLLVGVTGSIACGKSTVTAMLEEKGALLIDFDRIAREVVKPGTRGLEAIADCFGSRVLDKDGSLDRKTLSRIVFGDREKREKLEGITHPPIFEAFFQQVNAIAAKDPQAIIQVAVPLLIELNLQFLFDRIIVVYLSPEEQIRRLAARDGISEEDASTLISSQLSPEQKLPFADFVIRNDGTREETREQVEQTWEQLKTIQAAQGSGAQHT